MERTCVKTIVIKWGGSAIQTQENVSAIVQDIAQLKTLGMHPVIVHGGGAEISKTCQQMGITSQFVDGLRVTDKHVMEIVQMVLVGKMNKELVCSLNQKGVLAVGISGQDANLLVAIKSKHPSGTDLGYVGDVSQVNPAILRTLIEAGYIPVVAPIATSLEGLSLNINADSAASQIAISLKADQLIFLSDVPGILEGATKIDRLHPAQAADWIANGKISGGMIPKVEGAFAALEQGVEEVYILDGRVPHSLLLHFQGSKQTGTAFVRA